MEAARPLLVLAGGALALLAGLPGMAARSSEGPATTAATRAATVASTTVVPTSLQNDGRPRTFVLHVPAGLTGPAPLVVALHAHSQTTDKVRAYTRLEALADDAGFVVAFPSGAGGSWNAGGCCRPSSDLGTDDVAFLDEVLELAQDRAPVDAARISLTGISNGGMMALKYACDRASVVASVTVVGAPLVAPCTPSEPVDVLLLQGENDSVVPVAGGPYPPLGVVFPPVEASLAPLRAAGGDVQLRVLPTAGHGWMTVDRHGLDATSEVWAWAKAHPR